MSASTKSMVAPSTYGRLAGSTATAMPLRSPTASSGSRASSSARPNGHAIRDQAGGPGKIVHAIQSHGDHPGIPRVTPLEKTLYAVDELCGFVTAVALERPSKKVAEVEPSSVRKKMKDKAFARAVSRELMLAGADDLGIPFDELIVEVVAPLHPTPYHLGLAAA